MADSFCINLLLFSISIYLVSSAYESAAAAIVDCFFFFLFEVVFFWLREEFPGTPTYYTFSWTFDVFLVSSVFTYAVSLTVFFGSFTDLPAASFLVEVISSLAFTWDEELIVTEAAIPIACAF